MEIKLNLKNDFDVLEDGTSYNLPTYKVVDGEGIKRTGSYLKLHFVRGSKLGTEDVEKRSGTLHEHLLSVMIHDLQFKNKLVPSRETSILITKLQEAENWLLRRQIDRAARAVVDTYQK